MNIRIGDIIHDARVLKRITLKHLSKLSGVSAMYISEIENYKRIPCNGKALNKLSVVLGLDYGNLIAQAVEEKYIFKEPINSEKKPHSLNYILARELFRLDPISKETYDECISILNEYKYKSR